METQTKLYRMKSVQPATDLDEVGGLVRAFRVNFVTASGVSDYVTIPETEYTPENVAKVVQDKALLHEKVVSIEGPIMVNGQPMNPHPWSETG